MPIYEYECTQCSNRIEVTQKMSDAPLTQCEACSGTLKKLISLSSFAFKGTGFYTTDYKRTPAQNSESAGHSTPAPAVTAPTPAKV